MEKTFDFNAIEHLTECNDSGCDECDGLMAFYQTCDLCHQWCHNSTVNVVKIVDGAATVACEMCSREAIGGQDCE